MTRPLTTAIAITLGAAIVVALAVSIAWCTHANAAEMPDVRAMMVQVERALVAHGYPEAEGYGAQRPPMVYLATDLPRGAAGTYVPGYIALDAEQPEGCLPIGLGHELSHDAAVRMNLIWAVPNWAVRAELERIADVVERAVEESGPMAPNCLMKRLADR